jgi:hypothetical protein
VQSRTSVGNQINSTESLGQRLSVTNLARDRRSVGLARRRARNGRTSVLHSEAMDLPARQLSRDVGRLSPNVGRFAVSLSEAFGRRPPEYVAPPCAAASAFPWNGSTGGRGILSLLADPSLARRLIRFEPRYSDLETIIETAWRSRAQAGRGHHTGIPTPFTPS